MKNLIKYEKLSKDLKNEIKKYHKSRADKGFREDESMDEWFNNEFDGWLIEKFQKSGRDNKRKHFRLDVELPIKIIDTLIESSSDDSTAIDLIGKVVNISRGGIYFKYEKRIEISSIIKVIIDLNHIDKELSSIEALAMVVRLDKLKNDEYGIGIMFSSIYENARRSIDFFIIKNLSHYIYTDI